jgi:hypothetical protein
MSAGGQNRLAPEVVAQREAHALVLLREGLPRREVIARAKLPAAAIKRIAAEHGVPKLKPGNPIGNPLQHITRMTHEELDALEARVRAARLTRRKRPARTVLRSDPSGGAYVSGAAPGPWLEVGMRHAPARDDSDSPGGVCDDPVRRGHSFWFDTAPAVRKGYV